MEIKKYSRDAFADATRENKNKNKSNYNLDSNLFSQKYQLIFRVLDYGQENAISEKEICTILGLTSSEFEKELQRERREPNGPGNFICCVPGNDGGYFLPKNMDEFRHYYNWMHARAVQQLETIKEAGKRLEELDHIDSGQLDFSDLLREGESDD